MQPLPDPRLLAEAFALGNPLAPMTPETSGNINQIARLTTDRGEFAVKVMNPDPGLADFADALERAFRFESVAFDAGIGAPRPIPTTEGCCLATIPRDGVPDALVRVHEWVEGTALQQIVYPPPTATRIGEVIARIHALGVPPDDGRGDWLRDFGVAHWEALTERIERSQLEWAWQYRAMMPDVAKIEALVSAAREESGPTVMSHRDADAKNFIQTADGAFLLVDWDQAGPVAPQQEVASLALRWGGVVLGEPAPNVVRGFLDGYRAGGGHLEVFRATDCAGFINAMLGWYELNARRALGESPYGPAGAAGATHAVLRGFANIRRFAASTERWTEILNA